MGADLVNTTNNSFTLTRDMITAQHHQLTPPPSEASTSVMTPPATTIKMEDLTMPTPMSTVPLHTSPTSSPAPAGADSKSVKKRKSWGQVLPEPKTNLPPRKRAKTEDEKEQRRIERVKRNRLAAHNSRERKRQEVEQLQLEKDALEAQLRAAHDRIKHQAAVITALKNGESADIPEPTFSSPTTSLVDSFDDDSTQPDTICPRQTSTSFPSPVSMDDMDTPRDDSCQPETPAYSELAAPEADQTRYPAAILCDLQCRSASTQPSSAATSSLNFQWAMAFLSLLALNLETMNRLLAISSTSTSALSLLASLTSPSSLTASSLTTLAHSLTAFQTLLTQSLSTCRQISAQHSLATNLSQRKPRVKVVARSLGEFRVGLESAQARRRLRLASRVRSRRRGSASLQREIQRSLASLGAENHGKAFMWSSRESSVGGTVH